MDESKSPRLSNGIMDFSMGFFLLWVLLLKSAICVIGGILYHVREEQPPSTLIGSLAGDQGLPDTGHLYKLEVGAPYLRVDGKTGEIFTTEIPIDRETLKDCRIKGKPCFLEFEVSITDLIQNQSPRLIEGRIEVQDINDNTPQFASPVLTLSVQENTHMGATFSIPLATDKDTERNGVADYVLTAGPEALALFDLQVTDDRGEKLPQLIVMGNLDRELKDSYDLNIKAMDGGSPSRHSSALLRVIITDANDNAPKFEKSSYEAEVSENSPVGHSVLQLPHRRVTFSTANPVQDLQDTSQQSYYDSGLEESETPSSKSSSGPRIGPLALPEDHYERTMPDGSIGEMEHPENGENRFPGQSVGCEIPVEQSGLWSSAHINYLLYLISFPVLPYDC
uniref:Cadherin domain-containing protein n=1 Tax=Electrophorus electricus TaxID=8005 RepID=A0A4W4GFQ2_ELEEL